jgi:hypothetical protein
MEDEVLTKLLEKGMLPIQLPPGFTSTTFASALPAFQEKWEALDKGRKPYASLPEKFSVPRSSYYRRNISIVNPVGYYFLSRDIARHWSLIEVHYRKSRLSRSIPNFEESLRAIKLTKFSELYEEKVLAGAGYQYAVITDVTNYFPTLYTHTIPWALHGKVAAKSNRRSGAGGMYGNDLDKRAMAVQDGQTVGLPIGPDTSHILAEIIGIAVDLKLREELGACPAGFRYVDDFFLFFNTREEAERGLAAVIKAVNSYELQINAAKTRITKVSDIIEESWKYAVKRLKISPRRKAQRDDIHHYFEALFSLEKKYRDESLIKYGLRQISSTIIKKSNWPVFEAYLLKCGYGFPNTIQVITHILFTYHYHHYEMNRDAISRFCNNIITSAAASDHHGEVAWLLWACKELQIELDSDSVHEVERMGSSVCTLILLDLLKHRLITEMPNPAALTACAQESALSDSKWLLAYEAGRRDWLGVGDTSFIDNHKFFGYLKTAGVAFYDENKHCHPIFNFRVAPKISEEFDFDTDELIEDKFEFDEMDDEYFDKVFDSDESDDDESDDDGSNNDESDRSTGGGENSLEDIHTFLKDLHIPV